MISKPSLFGKSRREVEHTRFYGAAWRRARLRFLMQNPLCVYCQKQGLVTAATVVDHITPHKGDMGLFWDVSNWQSLCKTHHDAAKQREENAGASREIGLDGWPVTEKEE